MKLLLITVFTSVLLVLFSVSAVFPDSTDACAVVTSYTRDTTEEEGGEEVRPEPEAEMRCTRACVSEGCCHFALTEDGTCLIEPPEPSPWLPVDNTLERFFRDDENDVTFVLRQDNSTDFQRPWSDYKRGFGDVTNFWLGLDKLHELTKCEGYGVRATITDWDGEEFSAYYNEFEVGPESSKYQLIVGEYDSSLSSVKDSFSYHNGMGFTTFDQDNDMYGLNCAILYPGGWWNNNCHNVKPTGQYLLWGEVSMNGINWVNDQHSSFYSFKTMRLALVKRKTLSMGIVSIG